METGRDSPRPAVRSYFRLGHKAAVSAVSGWPAKGVGQRGKPLERKLLRPGGRFLQRDGAVCDGVEAVHAVLIQRLRVRAHAAGEHTDRNVALPLCRLRHAHGYLAEQRLTVRSALARDDQIGVLNLSGEVLQLEYHVDAPPELGVHKGVQRRAQTAGGSGARAIGHVRAELRDLLGFYLRLAPAYRDYGSGVFLLEPAYHLAGFAPALGGHGA